MTIFTHRFLDLDAVASIYAAKRFMVGHDHDVRFVSTSFDGKTMADGDVAVDIEAGGKGIKRNIESNGCTASVFSKIIRDNASPEAIEVLRPVMNYIDMQGEDGSAVKSLVVDRNDYGGVETLEATSLAAIFNAVKSVYKHDPEVADYMSVIFEGLLQTGFSRMRCKKEAEKVEIPYSSVALVRGSKEPGLNAWIFSNNETIDAIVYVDGNNLGVTRRNSSDVRMDDESIKKIVREAGEESEWFFNPAGLLAAHGTHKAPAKNMSKINPKKLAAAVSDLICY